jgi:hypothetical protein
MARQASSLVLLLRDNARLARWTTLALRSSLICTRSASVCSREVRFHESALPACPTCSLYPITPCTFPFPILHPRNHVVTKGIDEQPVISQHSLPVFLAEIYHMAGKLIFSPCEYTMYRLIRRERYKRLIAVGI